MTEAPSTDPWTPASEAGGEMFQPKDHIGENLLITPTAYKEGMTTKFTKPGETTDAVIADIVFIKPKVEDCEEVLGAYIFQGRLINKTKGKVGNGMVLGKLITEPTDKGNDAYDLEDVSPAAAEAARAYYSAKMAPPF